MPAVRAHVTRPGDAPLLTAAPMHDASGLLRAGDVRRLRARLDRDGYLLLRGLLPADVVLEARACIARDVLVPEGFVDAADAATLVARDASRSPGLLARPDVARAPPVRAVLEHPALYALMDMLLDAPAATVEYKWLRAVPRACFTGVHTDRVYLGRGSQRLLTAWIPLGDVPVAQGSLLVAAGSHRARRFAALRDGYGRSTVGADGVESGWLSRDGDAVARKFGFRWLTTDFAAGDVCVLGLDVLHLTGSNDTDRYRLSCDTRWQPARDPVDPRLRLVPRPPSLEQTHAETVTQTALLRA